MQMYNATIELDHDAEAFADTDGGRLLTELADYHPVVARSVLGRAEVIVSMPAESVWQATTTARALTERLPVVRITVETSADFDRLSEISVPPLLSVSEVADRLGITRAGVQHRIDRGALPAVKIGTTWAVPASAIPEPA